MSWASFHVLEVMSSSKYLQKRIGYLAAAQSFRAETEVLMLATNLLKKVGNFACNQFRDQENSCKKIGYRLIICVESVVTTSDITAHCYIFTSYVTAE